MALSRASGRAVTSAVTPRALSPRAQKLVEKQVAAFKKRLADLARMQQEQGVEGVPPAVPANTCERPRTPSHSPPPDPGPPPAGG